ncbi:MAG: HupE/UreJ family protein, partial [Chthoniobacterales bacterium]
MRKSPRKTVLRLSLLVFLLSPTSAWAHTQIGEVAGFTTGFHHPLSGWDHLLVMLAVGVWAAQRGGRSVWLLPLSFVAVMSLGGLVGSSGVTLPGVEAIILLSVVVFGLVVLLRPRCRTSVSLLLVAFFAFFHGFAHGHEMPASASLLSFALGFIIATLFLHGAGILTLRGLILAAGILLRGAAMAQDAVAPPSPTPANAAATETERLVVLGRGDDLIGYAATSSQGTIGATALPKR